MPVERVCRVDSMEKISVSAYSMILDVGPLPEAPLPGQFVHIKCGAAQLLRRPISICETAENRMRLVFEERGDGTAWLAERKVGDSVNLLGALGHGFDVTPPKLLLVGGGIGVPPMLSCARAARGEVHAVLAFHSGNKAILLDEFAQTCASVTVTTDDGTMGEHGYADGAVRKFLEGADPAAPVSVLVCGPKPMLRAVAQVAAEFGASCQVSMEERMGCGVGACLVCACKMADGHMKHACKDGPVFDAEEVAWDD